MQVFKKIFNLNFIYQKNLKKDKEHSTNKIFKLINSNHFSLKLKKITKIILKIRSINK